MGTAYGTAGCGVVGGRQSAWSRCGSWPRRCPPICRSRCGAPPEPVEKLRPAGSGPITPLPGGRKRLVSACQALGQGPWRARGLHDRHMTCPRAFPQRRVARSGGSSEATGMLGRVRCYRKFPALDSRCQIHTQPTETDGSLECQSQSALGRRFAAAAGRAAVPVIRLPSSRRIVMRNIRWGV